LLFTFKESVGNILFWLVDNDKNKTGLIESGREGVELACSAHEKKNGGGSLVNLLMSHPFLTLVFIKTGKIHHRVRGC
jgi:hypothetical protein